MGIKGLSKYSKFLKDKQVERWQNNLARGSQITAQVALRRLSRICEILNTTPGDMVKKAKSNPKTFQDTIEDMVSKLEKEDKSPGYITDMLKTIKSWLRYNEITLTRRIKIANSTATPTIENEQIPSQEELAKVLRSSPSRIRVAVALIAFSDLRPQTIGNHDGSDGLMLKDLPELKIKDGKVEFEKIPTMVMVRSPLSKARHKYFTFLSSEGCTYLREYLEERIRLKEELTQESPLVSHERTEAADKKFMMTTKVTHHIRKAMQRAGVYKRPYVLRAYAETQLIISESKGKISHPYLQFIAGHKGDIEARYSTNKGRVSPEMIEDIRNAYKQCEPFLSTLAQPTEQGAIVREAKIEALKTLAKSMFGIDLLEVKIAKERELNRDLSLDELDDLFEIEIKKKREEQDKPDPQKIVNESELELCLMSGWQFVSVLPSQKILIRR